eukprot:7046579-Prymnesium_polylepis.1
MAPTRPNDAGPMRPGLLIPKYARASWLIACAPSHPPARRLHARRFSAAVAVREPSAAMYE